MGGSVNHGVCLSLTAFVDRPHHRRHHHDLTKDGGWGFPGPIPPPPLSLPWLVRLLAGGPWFARTTPPPKDIGLVIDAAVSGAARVTPSVPAPASPGSLYGTRTTAKTKTNGCY